MLVDSQICYSLAKYGEEESFVNQVTSGTNELFKSLTGMFYYRCYTPINGRFVRLQKAKINSVSPNMAISVAEVQVWSCRSGQYMGHWSFQCRSCTPLDCPNYACDNYYGCKDFFLTGSQTSAPNVAMHRPVTVFNELNTRPSGRAVDGVRYQRDFFCYSSSVYAEPGRHFLRIELDGLYQIIKCRVTRYAGTGEDS